jgi:hypothetical protein
MTRHMRWVLCGLALALSILRAVGDASAQTLYSSGQTVQPAFEGWERNRDGTFTFWFGYLNRNYVEEPIVPIGPDNFLEPGPADRGQPTHFYPRRQMFVFNVTVAADWGKKDLVWTVRHNGKALTAVASLLPSWIIDEGVWKANRGSGQSSPEPNERMRMKEGEYRPNQRPSVNVVGDSTLSVTLPATVTLTVAASDDGKPGPRPRRPPRTSPGIPPQTPDEPLPLNLPAIGGRRPSAGSGTGGPTDQNMVKASVAYETGLAVTWLHYRGPGRVTFEPMSQPVKPEDGKAVTTASFSTAGTYVIRAVADDGNYTTPVDVTVVVKEAPQTRR